MSSKVNKRVKLAIAGFFIFIISAFAYLSYLQMRHKQVMAKYKEYEVFEKQSYYGDNWFLKITSKRRVDATFLGGHSEVSNLEGFQDIQNLETLSFIDHPRIDLSPIKNNKSLKNLIIQNTDISDISFIKELTSLEVLSLEGTRVIDLSPLKKLTKLKILYVNNTAVSDISVLSCLRDLQILDISETFIEDLSPLANLSKLYTLDVQFSLIRNFEPIEKTPFYSLLVDEVQLKNLKADSFSNISVHEGIDPEDLEVRGRGHFKYPSLWKSIYSWIPEKLVDSREYLESIKK